MVKENKKTFCFDIDGVIMTLVDVSNYSLAKPIPETITIINTLFERGHYIILFTARGYITKMDWTELTIQQLNDAGVNYHELKFGKPAADYYIDDRMIDLSFISTQITKNAF